VLTRQPAQLRAAATKCLFLTGACMGLTFLAQQMAGSAPLIPSWSQHWPALMAWMPVLVFGPIAVWLLDRVET
jgi:DMSO reductase anchor subunit